MLHVSTRGAAAPLSFSDALLAGLARDGGLYVPESWPQISRSEIAGLSGVRYADAAKRVLRPLIDGEIADAALDRMIEDAYSGFRHPAICPLTQIDDNLFLLELFHGPTLAFKDVAMQLLGRLMDHVLRQRGSRATIVGATSGDTGSAAVEAFKGLDQVDVFVLFPHGRVSEVQRRQMTTVACPNVHAIAIDGTFDDCQDIVKSMFQHGDFAQDVHLSGVNSINWARVAAQAVYYFTSAVSLGSPHRPVSFAVPTGNFGDILAGWVAKRMGLPIDRLMIGTNANDILARTLEHGAYELRGVQPTTSPSMDIQISSNFERLLFEALGRDSSSLGRLMAGLKQSGGFSLDPAVLQTVRDEFDAAAVHEPEVVEEIAGTYRKTGMVLDPHSAIGVRAGRRLLQKDPATPVVALATAHPAKFPDAVSQATGAGRPALPPHLADLLDRPELIANLPNDQAAVERYIRERARITAGA
ncbi:threonine synthase [Methylobacterium haplocladii]|uniref:Threonine synthase n=1 Tax=Methylobacterium haplocladii TaxID=1176176 RepID=A0A512IU84_9HYPH|nr:threonine synthase [Methylobacterium haplocladii]GEP01263.1 threonine synthase [Methylobacterium haplocladii]GJD82161.1 Threonine synthase [Methylobacterium haplocladii]GLS60622.1 threonine synthase [Methylobacterium haplocladii]